MLRDLQLDRVSYATVNLWATLLGAAICLPIGRVFDRFGLRYTTASLTLLLAFAVWGMSALAGGVLALFGLVLATRALGQSALSVASITAVGKSFDRGVGVAMGVYSVLLTVLFAAAFTFVGTTVRTSGWRVAWAQVAMALVLVGVPAAVLLRGRSGRVSAAESRGEHGLTLAEALRTPAFWVFGGATSLFGLVSSGLGLFNEAVLAERGFDQQTYVTLLAGTTVIGLGGQVVCGWLTLRWPMQRLLGVAMLAYAAGLGTLPVLTTHAQLWAFAALIGVSGGMITVIFFAVWTRAFGPRHLGRIQGAAQMLTVLASAIGPLVFAQSASWTGSYFPALWGLAPCVLLVGLVAFRVGLPGARPV
jgi:MFS family permease